MSRCLTIAAAQMGPISRNDARPQVVRRLMDLLHQAHQRGCELVVFPECALTAFFPHWWIETECEIDAYCEHTIPNSETQPFFDEAARLRIGICIGYAELAPDRDKSGQSKRFNSSLLVERDGRVVGNYRKVHLPGHADHRPANPFQNLERRYFTPGNLGFPVWPAFGGRVGMLICNDRRWPESYRMLGLQGADIVLLGYNTPRNYPEYPETDRLADFHHLLSLQAGAYQNGMWVVAAAKAGVEEGVDQIGASAIVAPSGEVVARSATLEDEVISYRCDLDLCNTYKRGVFPPTSRRVDQYALLTRAGQ